MTVYTSRSGLLGGTGDIMLEVGTQQITPQSAAPQCSVGPGPSVRFDFTVAGASAHIPTGVGSANGYVLYMDLYAETLGSETSVFSRVSPSIRPLRLRSDGRLAVYDVNNNFLGLSISSVAGIWRQVVLVDDATGQQRTVHLFIDGVEELVVTPDYAVIGYRLSEARSSDGWGWGDKLSSDQSTGTVYLMRNALLRSFTEESESPRFVQWPVIRTSPRRIPTAQGAIANWTNGTTPSPNTWQDVNEFPNDGDTSYIADTTSPGGDIHLFVSGDSNPLPSGASVLGVQISCSGRLTGSAKTFGEVLVYVNAQTVSSGFMGSGDWQGHAGLFTTKPNGSPWQPDDFNPNTFNFGVKSSSDDPPGSLCSNICYQIVYWTELLPLATTPRQPSVKRHYSFIY